MFFADKQSLKCHIIKLVTLLSTLSGFLLANVCYPKSDLPHVLRDAVQDTYQSSYTVTTGSVNLNALFLGGFTLNTADLVVGDDFTTEARFPVITRLNLSTNRPDFVKVFSGRANGIQRVIQLALSPAETELAVIFGQNRFIGYDRHFFCKILASEGKQISNKVTQIRTGKWSDKASRQLINGIVWDPYNSIYLVSYMREEGHTFNAEYTKYEGIQSLIALNAVDGSEKFYTELTDHFGRSGALAYIDRGSNQPNLYVGGSMDVCDPNLGTFNPCWTLSINRFNPNGQVHSQTQIREDGANYITDQTTHPFISQMHYDTAQEILFGSTNTADRARPGESIYFFMLDLDVNGDPRSDNLHLSKVDPSLMFNINKFIVVGLRPTLEGNKIHALIQDRSSLFYAVIDLIANTYSATRIQVIYATLQSGYDAAAHFMGSGVEQQDGLNIYQAYVATQTKRYFWTFPRATVNTAQIFGIVLPTLHSDISDSCYTIGNKILQNWTLLDRPNADILQQSFTFGGCYLQPDCSITSDVQTYKQWDLQVQNLGKISECEPAYTPVNAVTGGTLDNQEAPHICGISNGQQIIVPFIPFTISDPSNCVDPQDSFSYHVLYDSTANKLEIQVEVSKLSKEISVKFLTGGPSVETLYPNFKIIASLPTGQTFEIPFKLLITDCYQFMVTAPTLFNDQQYFVTDPYAEYDFPVFTPTSTLCTVDYTNSVSPMNTWISGVSDNGGVGLKVGWQTDIVANKGIYQVQLKAQTQCSAPVYASYTLQVAEINPCTVDPIIFQPFQQSYISQIYEAAVTIIVDSTSIQSPTGCEPVIFLFEDANNGQSLDSSIFTENLSSTTNTLSWQTNDPSKVGIYTVRIRVKFQNYLINSGFTDVTIDIQNLCEIAPLLTPGSFFSVFPTYKATLPSVTSPVFDQWTPDPAYCPLPAYSFEITPPIADTTVLTLNSADRTFTAFTTDTNLIGIYTVTVKGQTPQGITVNDPSVTFTFEIGAPCETVTFTLLPAILSENPIRYEIQGPEDEEEFEEIHVQPSILYAQCPTNYEFKLTMRDGSPIPSMFTFDSVLKTLKTFTSTEPASTQQLKLQVKYADQGSTVYDFRGELNFDVEIVDVCSNGAVINANPQTNPPDYYYTPGGIQFIVNPFTITPSFCEQTISCRCSNVDGDFPCDLNSASILISFDSSNLQINVDLSDKDSIFKPGPLEFTITTSVGSVQQSATITLNLVDPCPTSTIQIQSHPFIDLEYTIRDIDKEFNWQIPQITLQQSTRVDCGSLSLDFYLDDTTQTPLSAYPTLFEDNRTSDPFVLKIKQTNDASLKGVYQIKFRVYFVDYTTVEDNLASPFVVTVVDSCDNPASLSGPATLPNQEYTLTDNDSTPIIVPQFASNPSWCQIAYSISILGQTSFSPIIFDSDPNIRSLIFTSTGITDLSLSGPTSTTYQVLIEGVSGIASGEKTFSTTFDFTLKNPCIDKQFVKLQATNTLQSITYTPFEPRQTWSIPDFTIFTKPNSHNLCGPFTLTSRVFPLNMYPDKDTTPVSFDFSLTENQFSIYSEDKNLYLINQNSSRYFVRGIFTNYPTNRRTLWSDMYFLNPCDEASLSIASNTFIDVNYALRDNLNSQAWNFANIVSSSTPADCGGYQIDFFVESEVPEAPISSFPALFEKQNTAISKNFNVKYTEDTSLVGSYQIAFVITQVEGLNISVRQSNAFTVSVSDPCITPASLTNSTPPATQEYTLTDLDKSVSLTDTFSVSPIWCQISISADLSNPLVSQIMTFNPTSKEFTISSAAISDLTSSGLTQSAYTIPITAVSGTRSVLATLGLIVKNPCNNPNFVNILSFALLSQSYTLNEPRQTWNRPTFQIQTSPSTHSFCGDLSYEATALDAILGQTTVPIAFDQNLPSEHFAIASSNQLLIGEVEYTLQASLANYPTIKSAISSGKITIANPCTSATLSIVQNPFQDIKYVLKKPAVIQAWNLGIVKSSTTADCGGYDVKFFVESADLEQNVSEFDLLFTVIDTSGFEAFVVQSIDKSTVGTYSIAFEFSSKAAPQVKVRQSQAFTVTVEDQEIETDVAFNPEWMLELENQSFQIGTYYEYFMGDPLSPLNETMLVEVDLGQATKFATFKPETNSIDFERDLVPQQIVGQWLVSISGNYTNSYGNQEIVDRIIVIDIKGLPFEEVESSESAQIQPIPLLKEDDLVDVKVIDNINPKEQISVDMESKQLQPYIQELNSLGLLTIGFSNQMTPPQNLQSIQNVKIAVKDKEDSRKLQSNSIDEFKSGQKVNINSQSTLNSNQEIYRIYRALEMSLQPLESEQDLVENQIPKVDWDLVEFNEDFIVVQLQFSESDKIQSSIQSGQILFNLKIVFWDQDSFQDTLQQKITAGTTILWPIVQQVSKKDSQLLQKVTSWTKEISFYSLPLILFLLVTAGPLLPVYMFLNSLQLVSHLPLLRADTPAVANQFLKEILTAVRLHFSLLDEFSQKFLALNLAEDYNQITQNGLKSIDFATLVNDSGYKRSLIFNLYPIFVIFALIMILWLAFALLDCSKATQNKEIIFANGLVRVFYMGFFEIFLTLLIASALSSNSIWYRVYSAVVIILIAIFVGIFLNATRKNQGPNESDFYQSGTFMSSFWSIRPLKKDNILESNSEKSESSEVLSEFSKEIQSYEKIGIDLPQQTLEVDQNQILDNRDLQLSPNSRSDQVSGEIDDQLQVTPGIKSNNFFQLKNVNTAAYESFEKQKKHIVQNSNQNAMTPHKTSLRSDQLIDGQQQALTDQKLLQYFMLDEDQEIDQQYEQEQQQYLEGGQAEQTQQTQEADTQRNLIDHKQDFEPSHKQKSPDFDTVVKTAMIVKRVETLAKEAKLRIQKEQEIQVSQRSKTLFSGLKKNQPHHTALVHPIAYLIRRVIFALLIVFGSLIPFLSILALIGSCIFMLALVLTEKPWEDFRIDWQHAFNEFAFYLILIQIILFTGVPITSSAAFALGWSLVGTILVILFVNLLLIVYMSIMFTKLLAKRFYHTSPCGRKNKVQQATQQVLSEAKSDQIQDKQAILNQSGFHTIECQDQESGPQDQNDQSIRFQINKEDFKDEQREVEKDTQGPQEIDQVQYTVNYVNSAKQTKVPKEQKLISQEIQVETKQNSQKLQQENDVSGKSRNFNQDKELLSSETTKRAQYKKDLREITDRGFDDGVTPVQRMDEMIAEENFGLKEQIGQFQPFAESRFMNQAHDEILEIAPQEMSPITKFNNKDSNVDLRERDSPDNGIQQQKEESRFIDEIDINETLEEVKIAIVEVNSKSPNSNKNRSPLGSKKRSPTKKKIIPSFNMAQTIYSDSSKKQIKDKYVSKPQDNVTNLDRQQDVQLSKGEEFFIENAQNLKKDQEKKPMLRALERLGPINPQVQKILDTDTGSKKRVSQRQKMKAEKIGKLLSGPFAQIQLQPKEPSLLSLKSQSNHLQPKLLIKRSGSMPDMMRLVERNSMEESSDTEQKQFQSKRGSLPAIQSRRTSSIQSINANTNSAKDSFSFRKSQKMQSQRSIKDVHAMFNINNQVEHIPIAETQDRNKTRNAGKYGPLVSLRSKTPQNKARDNGEFQKVNYFERSKASLGDQLPQIDKKVRIPRETSFKGGILQKKQGPWELYNVSKDTLRMYDPNKSKFGLKRQEYSVQSDSVKKYQNDNLSQKLLLRLQTKVKRDFKPYWPQVEQKSSKMSSSIQEISQLEKRPSISPDLKRDQRKKTIDSVKIKTLDPIKKQQYQSFLQYEKSMIGKNRFDMIQKTEKNILLPMKKNQSLENIQQDKKILRSQSIDSSQNVLQNKLVTRGDQSSQADIYLKKRLDKSYSLKDQKSMLQRARSISCEQQEPQIRSISPYMWQHKSILEPIDSQVQYRKMLMHGEFPDKQIGEGFVDVQPHQFFKKGSLSPLKDRYPSIKGE